MGKPKITDEERLANYEVQDNGCWHWKGPRSKAGYGMIYQRRDGVFKGILAHRFFFEQHGGVLEGRKPLDHVCHNTDKTCTPEVECLHRRCVNPDHLQLVTTQINVLRGNGFAAVNAAKTHCKEGHAFTSTNTYVDPQGRRNCITCRRANYQNYYDGNGGEVAREYAKLRMRELRKDPAYREYKNARERERYIRRQAEKGKSVKARPNDRITYKEYQEAIDDKHTIHAGGAETP